MGKSEGSKRYIPVFEGLVTHDHIDKMGITVFLFIELLRRSKGKPTIETTYQNLKEKLGKPVRTLESWMSKLKDGDYISVKGKNPMIITIKKYRSIKYGKIQPLPDAANKDTNPQEVAGQENPDPQEVAGQENPDPQEVAGTSQEVAGSKPPTPLKTETPKPSLKYKNKTQGHGGNFGDSKGIKKPPKSKESKQPNPGVKILIDHYHDEFLRIHGSKPELGGNTGARAAKEFKDLLEANGRTLEEFKGLITDYLSLKDPKLHEAGYPVPWFSNRISGLLLQKKQPEAEFVY